MLELINGWHNKPIEFTLFDKGEIGKNLAQNKRVFLVPTPISGCNATSTSNAPPLCKAVAALKPAFSAPIYDGFKICNISLCFSLLFIMVMLNLL
ncbi:MAG: hypothetical protein ACJAR6_000873 [Oleispira sp.]|jgi:hypothetical protein